MKRNIATCADLHLRASRLDDIANAWRDALADMIKNKVNLLLIAGDVFDTPNIAGREASVGTILHRFLEPLMLFLDSGARVIAITGNHDLPTGQQLSVLKVLANIGVDCVDAPATLWHEDIIIGALPWIKDKKEEGYQKDIKANFKKHEGLKILLAHKEVGGAKMNKDYILTSNSINYISPEEIDEMGADIIAIGHFHMRQKYYIGSIAQHNFGEEDSPTGYALYKVSDDGKIKQEFREIYSPRYQTLEIKEDEKTPKLHFPCTDYYKLRYHRDFTKEEIAGLLEEPHIMIERASTKKTTSRTDEKLSAKDDDLSLLSSYIKAHPELKEIAEDMIETAKKMLIEI